MFGLGMGEILLIAVVALLFLGPDKLPGAAKSIGKGIRDFRKQTRELQDTIEHDSQLGDAMRELRGALRDEPVRPGQLPPKRPGASSPGSGGKERAGPAIAPARGAEPRPPAGSGAGEAGDAPDPGAAGANPRDDVAAPGDERVKRDRESEAPAAKGPAPRDGSAHG